MTVPFFNNNVDQFVTDLSDWYQIAGQDHYDEVVTLSDHMLQAASIAYDEGLSKSNVLSCLFHDIGHMIIDDKDNPSDLIGNIYHETIAASFLSDIFINDVVEPVKNHVVAKRWLCTSNKNYYDQLSPASKQSFEKQGSYMTIEEMKDFMSSKHFHISVKVREIDDRAKIKNKETYPISFYRNQIEECLKH